MKIRLTTDRAGPTGFHLAGDVINVPDAEAVRLVDTQQAEQLEPQRAVKGPPERMTQGHTPSPPRRK